MQKPEIVLSWSGFTDDHSGIKKYEWCLGPCSSSLPCTPFFDVSLARSITLTSSNFDFGKLVPGKYYCASVRVTDHAGNKMVAKSSTSMLYDNKRPLTGVVTDGSNSKRDADNQQSLEQISACWTGFDDNATAFNVCLVALFHLPCSHNGS